MRTLQVYTHHRSHRNMCIMRREQPLNWIESNRHNDFTPPTATERCLCVLRDPELLCIYPPDGQARASWLFHFRAFQLLEEMGGINSGCSS